MRTPAPWLCSCLLVLTVSGARADEPKPLEQLAPTLADVHAALVSAELALVRSEAIGVAVGLIQNRLAPWRAESRRLPVCEEPEVASLVARSRRFGPAWRDAAQTARIDATRAEQMAARSTVQPILGRSRSERIDRAAAAARVQAEAAAEAGEWHRRFVESAFDDCETRLEPAAGFPPPGSIGQGEATRPTAVIGIDHGTVCPDQFPANGEVVLLPEPRACWSPGGCACTPEPVYPGAVLGATAPTQR
jgi:hypothetical protein